MISYLINPILTPKTSIREYRRYGKRKVFVSRDLYSEWFDATYLITSVSVSESIEELDSCSVEFDNKQFKLLRDELFTERFVCMIFMGWNTPLEFMGSFIFDQPDIDFPSDGYPSLKFNGKSLPMIADETENIETYHCKSDKRIVEEIAKRHDWRVDTDKAPDRAFDYIARSGVSELSFVRDCGRLDKCHLYTTVKLERSKPIVTLHYHPPKESDDQILDLYYRASNPLILNLKSFSPSVVTWKRGTSYLLGGVDQKTGVPYTIQIPGDSKPEARSELDRRMTDKKRAYTMDGKNRNLPSSWTSDEYDLSDREFIKQDGTVVVDLAHTGTKQETQVIGEAVQESGQWIVEGSGVCLFGMPELHKTKLVYLNGLPKFDGLYLITSCTHSQGSEGFTTEFQAKTTGISSKESTPQFGSERREAPVPNIILPDNDTNRKYSRRSMDWYDRKQGSQDQR